MIPKRGMRFHGTRKFRLRDGIEEWTDTYEITSVARGYIYYRTVWSDGIQMTGAGGMKIAPDHVAYDLLDSSVPSFSSIFTGWVL
jgi:hypothetical protein